jgi:hypothetical protein
MIFSRTLSALRRSAVGFLAISAALPLVAAAQAPATSNPSSVYVNPRAAADDPRVGLKAGIYDAGEAASGLQLLTLVRKPGAFIPPPAPEPAPGTPAARGAGLTYANSDLAFSGKYAFMGNFYGITIYDVENPSAAKLITTIVCPGGQGDVSVYKNLLFMSVEGGGRIDCGTQGIPLPAGYVAPARPAPGAPRTPPPPVPPSPERIRGVRIFDISDITHPKQVGLIQNCRGSHTHSLLVDPKDPNDVYVYIAGTAPSRSPLELEGCSAGGADDPTTANFTIVVVKVPLAHPDQAKVINSPRIFSDPETGKMNGLVSADVHNEHAAPRPTTGCHDITIDSYLGLAAGACAGNGILLDIKDPANPKRIEAVSDPNFSFWHSANFSNDGTKLIYTDEWGGGTQPRCRASDPMNWGADTIFDLSKSGKLTLDSYYKMPAPQTEQENCVAHNGSLIPIPGRDLLIQAWYQGGVSVMDFTDAHHPVEIAYFDRGPIDPAKMEIGGEWSAYWYNGYVYASEIARGLDVLKLAPNKFITQNEIDAANQVHFDTLNVQNQPHIVYPQTLLTAKAYLDQLARGESLSADKIATLNGLIEKKQTAKLRSMAGSLDKDAASAKTPADAERLKELAIIFKKGGATTASLASHATAGTGR